VRVGLSIPSTVAEGDRDTLCEWIRRIDAGPFSCLATGERLASPFLDLMGVLSAAAVLTERVPIQALISLAPLHEPVLLAKQAATVDVLSGGRFTLGVGVGMRDYDYALAGKPEVFPKRLAALDERVASLRSIWAGEYALPADAPPLGPPPVQLGGPPIFASSLGPKSMRRAVRWADGLAGFHMGPDLKEIEAIFDAFRANWSEAGRSGAPTLQMAFWFGLVDSPAERVVAFADDYLSIFGREFARVRSRRCNATSPGAIREILRRLEDLGCDEAIMTPTTASLDELAATEDLVASL
jgi:alkanesulfonate monooxygenase SsuD/methylene tetrahydromethanopterin reductase-like flavin-dependent oxidoreductase (luciferase family)